MKTITLHCTRLGAFHWRFVLERKQEVFQARNRESGKQLWIYCTMTRRQHEMILRTQSLENCKKLKNDAHTSRREIIEDSLQR